MSAMEKVTVDKSYFDALLRRADFHTSTQILGRADPANVTISRVEYDGLLRTSTEFELLKNALFAGGLTSESLGMLISGASDSSQRQPLPNTWADDFDDMPNQLTQSGPFLNGAVQSNDVPWKASNNSGAFNLAPGSGAFKPNEQRPFATSLQTPGAQRHTSYGPPPSSVPEDVAFEADSILGDGNTELGTLAHNNGSTLRTLYFCNLSSRTSYRDIVSVLRGGKILSINIRSERSATVTFLDSAAEYLAWVKRHDIYILDKRAEVRWAERQFTLNGHIANKVANGATRNILIRNAVEKGLTEESIRDDMEHIHNLVIIDVRFRNGDAYVSTNSVHNALFARTCMMSRTTYRGCKILFYRDECDVPLPVRTQPSTKSLSQAPAKKNMPPSNRFGMLNTSSDGSNASDEENRCPVTNHADDSDDDSDVLHITPRAGVRLDFLDSESIA